MWQKRKVEYVGWVGVGWGGFWLIVLIVLYPYPGDHCLLAFKLLIYFHSDVQQRKSSKDVNHCNALVNLYWESSNDIPSLPWGRRPPHPRAAAALSRHQKYVWLQGGGWEGQGIRIRFALGGGEGDCFERLSLELQGLGPHSLGAPWGKNVSPQGVGCSCRVQAGPQMWGQLATAAPDCTLAAPGHPIHGHRPKICHCQNFTRRGERMEE